MTLEQLGAEIADGTIDTVVIGLVDMQGRLMGKRVQGEYFLERATSEIDVCSSLLTLDMESDTTPGYTVSSIDLGYPDFPLHPDLATLRRMPWHEATALVLCDPRWPDGTAVAESPRQILRRQVERVRELGFEPMMSSELEFFVCRETYDQVHANGYLDVTPAGRYVTDGHLLAPGFDEPFIRKLRVAMKGADIPVEASKAEAWPGQHEITFRYGEPLSVADSHAIYKHGAKEIADQNGRSITFMAKPDHRWLMGSSCHVHSSLWKDGRNVFEGESEVFRQYLAGQVACVSELAVFVAPTVNSYKRFVGAGTWAGNTVTWAHDNRTTGFRVVGRGEAQRVEARVPGADVNPHLAFAALLAAGLHGIENGLEPPPPFEGNAYELDEAPSFPATLREAIRALENGTMARAALGGPVIDHYLNYARAEQRLFDRAVTDYERERMFERG
jgi:glutamine synthetase